MLRRATQVLFSPIRKTEFRHSWNAFKPVDDVILAAGAGAIKLGFPVISNETENIAEVPGALIACPNVC